MKSDKEKKRFLRGDETQRLSAGVQPDSYAPRFIYGGPPTGRQKKRSIPCGTDPENSKIFFVIISYWLVPYLQPHLRQPSAVPV